MKMVSASVAVVGVLALVLAIVEKLLSFQVDGVAASGASTQGREVTWA